MPLTTITIMFRCHDKALFIEFRPSLQKILGAWCLVVGKVPGSLQPALKRLVEGRFGFGVIKRLKYLASIILPKGSRSRAGRW